MQFDCFNEGNAEKSRNCKAKVKNQTKVKESAELTSESKDKRKIKTQKEVRKPERQMEE